MPAILEVVNRLTDEGPDVQLIAATHSPLVLASMEPHFDDDIDRLFHLDVAAGLVRLEAEPWAMQGDVLNWLVSDVFGLRQARSVEAERAIEAAEAFMRQEAGAAQGAEALAERLEIHRELERVLAGHDPFWPRWVVSAEGQAQGA